MSSQREKNTQKRKRKRGKTDLKPLLLLVWILMLPIGTIAIALPLCLIFPGIDGYLMIGAAFYFCLALTFLTGPAVVFWVIAPKRDKLKWFKESCKKYWKIFVPFEIVMLFLVVMGMGQSGTHILDIVQGEQEAIMTDAVVEIHHGYKNSRHAHLIGYVDGEKISLSVSNSVNSKFKEPGKYQKLEIVYYEHLGEVHEIEVIER